MDGWVAVPDVLLLQVYSYLSPHDKLAASSTCKHWRELLFHPVNWTKLKFYYCGGQNNDRKRESFLKQRIAHFISDCSIVLPTEASLVSDAADGNSSSFSLSQIDFDVGSLLQYLCVNKNLRALSFVQYHPEETGCSTDAKANSICHNNNNNRSSRGKDGSFFSANSRYNNLKHGDTLHFYVTGANDEDGVQEQPFTGMMTRSRSQKAREQNHKKSLNVSSGNCLESSEYFVEFDFLHSSACLKDLTSNTATVFRSDAALLRYVDYLRQIIKTANCLTHLSLGFVPSITLHNHEIVSWLAKHQTNHVRSLHVSRCQQLPDSLYQPIDFQDVLLLTSLQHLSIDTEDLSDQLVCSLSEGGRAKLASFHLTMFQHKEGVRLVHDRTWDLLHRSCPDLTLTLSIVRCADAIRDMMTVVNASMPLTHLIILFCDEFYVSGLHHVARHQASTLCSLHIVESMREGPMYYDISVDEQDPFVMMAWRCKKLCAFRVIGIAVREHDVLAVARLRGVQLRKFEVLEECITAFNNGESEFEEDFSMSFETFCEEISTSIGQEWLPLTEDDIDDSILYFDSSESEAFLPILTKYQTPLLHSTPDH